VLTPDGKNLNQRLVAEGHAAVYPRYGKVRDYYRLQDQAKARQIGIWERPGLQQTPWAYRQSQR